MQLGEAAAGGLQDLPAGIRRTGKTESFHPGRFDQGLAHDTAASHNQVEGASGQLRTMDYFAQRPGGARHQVGWFEDHRVAVSQSRRDFPGRNRNGKIPWGNDANDPHRLPQNIDFDPGSDGVQVLALDAQCLTCEELEYLAGASDFGNRFR
ncbi:hypothetical protein D3C86_1598340 [compost metagenome]